MKFFFSILTVIVAILSIAFSDTILASISPLTDIFNRSSNKSATTDTAYTHSINTAFEGLPIIPPISTHSKKSDAMSVPRAIRKAFMALEKAEGVGAKVRRTIGTPQLRNFSPFLMLDHFTSSPGAGFPDRTSREYVHSRWRWSFTNFTIRITYVLSGVIDHEDFAGNRGAIEAGDLQFMTAGRGIIHAEMPRESKDGVPVAGMQLWVDLPEELKMCEPRYRDLRASEIPQALVDDGKVKIKIISGQSHGVDSVRDLAYTPVWILDVEIQPGGSITQPLPAGWNAFAYTLAGSTSFGSGEEKAEIAQFHIAVFEQAGDTVTAAVDVNAKESSRFFLVAGLPLDQKVVQYGPFVLNSEEQVYQALEDYRLHQNGFERAKGWKSEIGKRMMH